MPDPDKHVFINCPYDDRYSEFFTALVFTVHALGFVPRCARESAEGSRPRLAEIIRIIGECRFGIHDLSRNLYEPDSKLPRFNMPFELGLYKGCSNAVHGTAHEKHCLILERNEREYLQYISDLAGHDVLSHSGDAKVMVRIVRDWLRKASGTMVPGGGAVWSKYIRFRTELDALADLHEVSPREQLIFVDLSYLARWWLDESDRGNPKP